jgi:hypothetical protein
MELPTTLPDNKLIDWKRGHGAGREKEREKK